MRTARVTAALVLGTAGLGFLPLSLVSPASAASSVQAAPSSEAWYQLNPTCSTPAGCQAPPAAPAAPVPAPPAPLPVAVPTGVPTSPYPAGTLHVAVTAGTETARTVLGLPTDVAGGVTAAQLSVPLDLDPADGSAMPETAKLLVCLTKAPVVSVEGSLDAPPTTDCGKTTPLAYVATPEPHLQADLAPLLSALPGATGLVLLPDRARLTPTEAWHVVFSTTGRGDSTKTGPAVLQVTPVDAPPSTEEQPPPADAAPAVGPVDVPLEASAPVADVEPELGGTAVALPVTEPGLPDQPAAQLAPAANTVALPESIRVGYAYPGVWLLPLALLVVVPLVGRALTADLTLRPPVEDQA